MTGPSVPQGTGGTLVERLTETLRPHQHAAYCIRKGHIPNGGYPAHLAEVAAQTVAAWVRGQEETVAEELCDHPPRVGGWCLACGIDTGVALGVLLDGIGVEG